MHAALYVSKTGLSAQDTQLTTVANNLANVGTVGFKRDRAVLKTCCIRSSASLALNPPRKPSCRPVCNWVPVCG